MDLLCKEEIVDFCKRHPLYDPSKKVVIGKGNLKGSVLIIGEAPGKTENELGDPFCGRSGEVVDIWIDATGIRKEVAITNSVFLMPLDEHGKIRKPTPEEIQEFKPYVEKIIASVSPKLIILLGSSATQCILGKKVGEAMGKIHDYRGIPVKVMYHPAYFLRNGIIGLEEFVKMYKLKPEQKHKMLVFDIETDSIVVGIANMKFFGAYSYAYDKHYIFENKLEIQALLNEHDVIVGYNINEFDIPIMKANGVKIQKGTIIVDLYKGVMNSGRKGVMGMANMPDNKLATVVKHLGIGEKKDLDFNLLKKATFTDEERKLIYEYLENDIKITKALFDWWINWSAPLAEFISDEQKAKLGYLTCSIPSYAYKVISNLTGIPEVYSDDRDEHEIFEGAFVQSDVETARGNLVSFDFASMYPHAEIQGNLFSPVTDDYTGPVFEKNELYPDLQGRYKADKMGKIEEAISTIYKWRKEFKKKKDPKEYALKIALNSTYGASTKKRFKNLYNPTIGPDTCCIGRNNVKYARKCFEEAGFKLLYSDTDSVYLEIPKGKTLSEVLAVRDKIIYDIKKHVPFPVDTFKLEMEHEIQYFQLFRKSDGVVRKKYYLYVTKENKIMVKGLPIVKSNCSKISKMVFEELKPEIIANLDCKFHKEKIDKIIEKYIQENVGSLAKMFRVKVASNYKLASQLDAQISAMYGQGTHYLVKNYRYGAGKSSKYCTIEEARKLEVSDLDLSSVYKELHYFITGGEEVVIDPPKIAKTKDDGQTSLSFWETDKSVKL